MKPLLFLLSFFSSLICGKHQMQLMYPEIWLKLEKMHNQSGLSTQTLTLSIFLEKKDLIAYTERSKKDVDDGKNQTSAKEFSQLF